MPRDTLPDQPVSPMATAFERLSRLREIADKTRGDQTDYTTCLFHGLRTDRVLAVMGLPAKYQVEPRRPHSPDTLGSQSGAEYVELARFFGISCSHFSMLCSSADISHKRARLEALVVCNAPHSPRQPRDENALRAQAERPLEDAELEVMLNR